MLNVPFANDVTAKVVPPGLLNWTLDTLAVGVALIVTIKFETKSAVVELKANPYPSKGSAVPVVDEKRW